MPNGFRIDRVIGAIGRGCPEGARPALTGDRVKNSYAVRNVWSSCVISGLQCSYSLRLASVRPQIERGGS